MNLKTLSDQARQQVPAGLEVEQWIEQYNKLFAELVVQECCAVVDQHEPLNTWTKRYSTLIREHFGVEE